MSDETPKFADGGVISTRLTDMSGWEIREYREQAIYPDGRIQCEYTILRKNPETGEWVKSAF